MTVVRGLVAEDNDDASHHHSRPRCSTSRLASAWMYLCLSICTMLLGLTLFLLAVHRQSNIDNGKGTSSSGSVDEDTEAAMTSYWLKLVAALIPAGEVLIPASPAYQALQWMVLRDPLGPLDNEEHIRQRYALSVLYFSWSGPDWAISESSGWLRQPTQQNSTLYHHECAWEGVSCNQQDKVTSLAIDGQEMFTISGGTIPTDIGRLDALETLALPLQGLKGTLPKEMGLLTNLETLDLSSNLLTSLDFTKLSLAELQVLRLSNNLFGGWVDFGVLERATQLRILEIGNNPELGGNPISRLSHWYNLESAEFSKTRLEGNLPEDIGLLSNLKTFIFAQGTNGTIPRSIASCFGLERLVIHDTGLFGGLPSEIGELLNLKVMEFNSNTQLGGEIPTEIGRLTSLTDLDLIRSNLQGTIPTEFGQLEALEKLKLDSNPLGGKVPSELGRLTNLQVLSLQRTRLTGTMPRAVCELGIVNIPASCLGTSTTFTCLCCECVGF